MTVLCAGCRLEMAGRRQAMGASSSTAFEQKVRAGRPVFHPRDASAVSVGSREERAAAVAMAFDAMGAASSERYIPPPIQKIIVDYDYAQTHCTDPIRSLPFHSRLRPSRRLIRCRAAVCIPSVFVCSFVVQCVPARSAE
jgi:hypothetical protein